MQVLCHEIYCGCNLFIHEKKNIMISLIIKIKGNGVSRLLFKDTIIKLLIKIKNNETNQRLYVYIILKMLTKTKNNEKDHFLEKNRL